MERRLKKLGIDHRTKRVPYMKRYRPEIRELTGQRHVPALIDGTEVVHDSKRCSTSITPTVLGPEARPHGPARWGFTICSR